MAQVYKPKYVKKILISKEATEKGIKKAANWINKNYAHCKKPLLLVGVLRGAIPFYARLAMDLNIECNFEFITISSFCGNMQAVGKPKILTNLRTDIRNRDVIVVEDVLDRAQTLSFLVKYLKTKKPKSLKTMVLVDKPNLRTVKFKADYVCFTLKGNPFLVGYGLDIKELARNLPYIAEFDTKYINKL